jgi:hypothetical protein
MIPPRSRKTKWRVDSASVQLSVRRISCFPRSGTHSALPTLLDVVIGQSAAILKLLSSENQALLVRGDPFDRDLEKMSMRNAMKKTPEIVSTHPPCPGF